MTHHVSMPAREPRHVAAVLGELMGGKCHPFGPLEGAFMATSGDVHGTMIEVYPVCDPSRTPARQPTTAGVQRDRKPLVGVPAVARSTG